MDGSGNKIDASPTKEFFISILGRDISLLDSVKDLVDNSVDGARRIRPAGDYKGLWVEVEAKDDHFMIVDNCGGISVDIARNYAFRFGRPNDAPKQDGSIGQFGVGMKRALFKMGRAFEIKSKSPDSHFDLQVDVERWKTLRDDDGKDVWEFEFSEVAEGEENPIEDCGTTLLVESLFPSISSEFSSEKFLSKLVDGLQQAHERSMDAGLEIRVNDVGINHGMATLLASSELKPIRIDKVFDANDVLAIRSQVKMTIYAGVSASDIHEAGWYIVCNGRQIVRANKDSLTGWATVLGETTTPKAHNQFSRFRGYVIFESDDSGALPWNTSKSGVDSESPVYQWALSEMVPALRQVIDFLNLLDAELDTGSTHLRSKLQSSVPTRLSALVASRTFVYPKPGEGQAAEKTVRVQYDRSIDDIDFAKEFFKVNSAKKAGEEALDYFLSRERA